MQVVLYDMKTQEYLDNIIWSVISDTAEKVIVDKDSCTCLTDKEVNSDNYQNLIEFDLKDLKTIDLVKGKMKSINLYIEEFIFELKNEYTYLNEDFFTPRDAIFFEIIQRLCSDQIYIESIVINKELLSLFEVENLSSETIMSYYKG